MVVEHIFYLSPITNRVSRSPRYSDLPGEWILYRPGMKLNASHVTITGLKPYTKYQVSKIPPMSPIVWLVSQQSGEYMYSLAIELLSDDLQKRDGSCQAPRQICLRVTATPGPVELAPPPPPGQSPTDRTLWWGPPRWWHVPCRRAAAGRLPGDIVRRRWSACWISRAPRRPGRVGEAGGWGGGGG